MELTVPFLVSVPPTILSTRVSPVIEQLVNACVINSGTALNVKMT